MPPIIGITTKGQHELAVSNIYYKRLYTMPALYVEAVRRAGGIPLLIPPGDAYWKDILERVDAVIFSGGSDVSPARYGGDNHPNLTTLDAERDETEIAMAQYLITTDKPILAVCRGMQMMNVALGGTLHPHIPDIREVDIHRDNGGWTVHDVTVDDDSLLASVMGTTAVNTYSGHHQAVADIAPNLSVIATAPDGIVEALEHKSHPWMLAIQWHPEKSAATDPTQQALFDELVKVV